jgi:hypothetical protein
MTVRKALLKIATYFLKHSPSYMSNNSQGNIISLAITNLQEKQRQQTVEAAVDMVASRNTMAILAPESAGNFGKSTTTSTT